MAKPLIAQVAEWALRRPNGVTVGDIILKFGVTRKQVGHLKLQLRVSSMYESHWEKHNYGPIKGFTEHRLFVAAIKKRRPSVRSYYYATPLPGHPAEPFVFHGNHTLLEQGFCDGSVRNHLGKPSSYAGYVWTRSPIKGYKYTAVKGE